MLTSDPEIGVKQRRGSRNSRPSTPCLRAAPFSSSFRLLKDEAEEWGSLRTEIVKVESGGSEKVGEKTNKHPHHSP